MRVELQVVGGVFLMHCAYSDLRCGMISLRACMLAGGVGIAVRLLPALGLLSLAEGNTVSALSYGDRIVALLTGLFAAVLPGFILMGLAVGSGEQVGKGDAWMLIVLGILTGAIPCIRIFILALPISLFHAAMKRLISGKDGTGEIVFAPDLLAAYVILAAVT